MKDEARIESLDNAVERVQPRPDILEPPYGRHGKDTAKMVLQSAIYGLAYALPCRGQAVSYPPRILHFTQKGLVRPVKSQQTGETPRLFLDSMDVKE